MFRSLITPLTAAVVTLALAGALLTLDPDPEGAVQPALPVLLLLRGTIRTPQWFAGAKQEKGVKISFCRGL